MTEAPTDLILPILKKIQEDIAAFRSSVDARFDRVEQRLEHVEQRLERVEQLGIKQRRDSAGMLVMMRATVSDFNQRVTEIEERTTALERRKS